DLAPYLTILALVLATRLVPAIREPLESVVLSWRLNGFGAEFRPLGHPGTILAVALFASALATGRGRDLAPAAGTALRRLAPVALTLVALLTMSRLMDHAGMIDALAAEARRAGALWPLLAPFVGLLGTLVSAS